MPEKNLDWKDLWLKNYRGEGDCAGLNEFVKKLDFGAKKEASYLPWAVPERIFRLQGGECTLIHSEDNSTIVETDKTVLRLRIHPETGEAVEELAVSYFINVKATWMGQEHIERYPLQDSNGRALLSWNQNDLNRATQRAKVKAIAIVSGIGYKLFEDGDLQFEDETKDKTVNNAEKLIKNVKPKPASQSSTVPEIKPTPQSSTVPEVKPTPQSSTVPTEETEKISVEPPQDNIPLREEMEEVLKASYIKDETKRRKIEEKLNLFKKIQFKNLTDEEMYEIYLTVL